MVASYSSFHFWILATNSSRAKSVRLRPSSASTRFSTTVWVAMPAWSVPGIHTALSPAMRRQRMVMSWIVLFSPCPRCSRSVTLGGGMTMQ